MYSSTIIISFFIYSVIGYLCEVVYCSSIKKHFVNRGFLYGPYCPVYGVGALIVIYLLEPFKAHWYLVFIFGLILTSILEYLTSWLLERLFHMKLWDYSNHKININGRVCGLNSFLFGVMGVIAVYFIEPFASGVIDKIPAELRSLLANIISFGMAVDATFTVIHLNAFQKALKEIKEKADYIHSLDSVEVKALLEKELEKFKEKRAAVYAHFINSNPTLSAKSLEIREGLESYRAYLEKRTQIRREYKQALKANRADYVSKRRK